MGYRQNANILQNAQQHLAGSFLLRIDFADFFPSIRGDDVLQAIELGKGAGNIEFDISDREVVRRIVCRRDRLTIGAPSSPSASNAVMFRFDLAVQRTCLQAGVTYTRYADDLYFSTSAPNVLSDVLTAVRSELEAMRSLRLTINENKVTFTSRKRRRVVTGLILTPDRSVSLGRARKRYVRSLMHRALNQNVSFEELAYLRGFLAFVRGVEPAFIDKLSAKFGATAVDTVLGL